MKKIVEPFLKVLNVALTIVGHKEIVNLMMNHPDFRIETRLDKEYNAGKLAVNNARIDKSDVQLTEKESKALVKLISKNSTAYYDEYYDKIASARKTLMKMDKKSPEESEKHLSYCGSYDENGTLVHILQYDGQEFHIVDGCWQIRRYITRKDKKTNTIVEFCELAKNVYMPVSRYLEIEFGFEELLKKELKDLDKEDTSWMSEKQLAKHNDRRKTVQSVLDSGQSIAKNSTAFNYKNFKAKAASDK